jgi:hypothetical protein
MESTKLIFCKVGPNQRTIATVGGGDVGTCQIHYSRTGRACCRGEFLAEAAAVRVSSFWCAPRPIQKEELSPFFTTEVLDAVRIVNLAQTGKTIPYPPFYERVRAGGQRLVPDSAHMAAIPFIDVAVFNKAPTLRTMFHTLVHVTQFAVVGLEKAMECYFRVLNESGLWMVVPLEEQAYRMDARYTRDPTDVFSVEEEVRDWLRKGRY